MKFNKILLAAVLMLALSLRVWKLGTVPAGFYLDEASIGYDAFSILQTGKDFHGHVLPLFFESFGEWKNPVYIYATVPSIAIFGLNVFATRLPAALFGVLAVFALFLVAKELFDEKLALLASTFLAFSPWALQFSRIAFEAAALPALFLFAFWFFLKGLQDPRSWNISAALFALCMYSYGAARLFIPLFLAALLWIFRAELIVDRKKLMAPIAIFIFLCIPLLLTGLLSPAVLFYRAGAVSILAPGHSLYEFPGNYVQYFSLKFLFIEGDANLRHSPPGYGQFLWFLAPLMIAGIVAGLYSHNKKSKLLFSWLFLFPVAAALTYEGSPHAIRSIAGVGLFELLGAAGAALLFAMTKRLAGMKIAVIAGFLFLLLSCANVWMFTGDYFTKYPAQSAAWFDDGLSDTFEHVKQIQGDYDHIVLSPEIYQAKMYAAFYLGIPPRMVQTGDYGKIVQCSHSSCGLKGRLLLLERVEEPTINDSFFIARDAAGKEAFKLEVALS
ncbi:MAG: glycosyltransferase family 39 protein [Candidatus Methanoperedens sp.]|nr:glycosyltransferase family 39 protein [Candidatus Methanoperedens sp.]